MKKRCLWCGCEFETDRRDKKYCNYYCGKRKHDYTFRRKKSENVEKNIALLKRNCDMCGKEYETYNRFKKYCCVICKRKSSWSRKKKKNRCYKKKKPCAVCGFDDLRAIQNHHINPSVSGSDGGIISLCANHHAIYHQIADNSSTTHLTKKDVINCIRCG